MVTTVFIRQSPMCGLSVSRIIVVTIDRPSINLNAFTNVFIIRHHPSSAIIIRYDHRFAMELILILRCRCSWEWRASEWKNGARVAGTHTSGCRIATWLKPWVEQQ